MERFATPFPGRIHRLGELATDVWWSWHPEARALFRRLDLAMWRSTAHNPARMLRMLGADVLQQAADDPVFLQLYDTSIAGLDATRQSATSWWHAEQAAADTRAIAYFSAEFALHQSLPIYAGGLGVLAGDHCKEASDLGLPLVGIGFMYPQGYFHQRVTNDGWQQEHYERINWADAPIETAITPDGKPCITAVPLGDRTVLAAVWRVRVGHVKLYLLDTDLDENAPWDRELSARLYGGDRETRIQQEVILGIGGVRVLRAMGIEPAVWHLNEGHAAFVVLQRIRELIEHGSSFDDALEQVRQTTVFTTHTPVPAGHDAFPFHLVEKHLAGSWGELGQHRARFLALGRVRQRARRAVQHDRAGAADGRRRQRRERAARPRDARDVAADVARPPRRRRSGPGHHQRRARPHLDRRRPAGAARGASGRRLGRRTSTIPACGSASTPFRTPTCGRRA